MSDETRGAGLVLVGYRGTGKSSLGRVIAGRVGVQFLDADAVLEQRRGLSIRQIFESHGEPVFRDWERETIESIVNDCPGCLLATGGGAILLAENRRLIRRHGLVVWLTAGVSTLKRRIGDDPARPALTALGTVDEIAEVLRQREPLYREVADWSVDTSRRHSSVVASEVIDAWNAQRRALGLPTLPIEEPAA